MVKNANEVLPADFDRRMRELLDEEDYLNYLSSLECPPLRFARKNPLKAVDDQLISSELGGYPLLPESAKPGRSSLHAAGAYYVQEPAAAKVAGLLPPLLPEGALVLDMCAAPGGKVTAAATARPDCFFVANEPIFSRTKILLSNIERMGLRNVTVTYFYAHETSKYGGGLFDAVIADVPCSGEGMYRKTEFHDADLSDAAVSACVERAASILDECDECLCDGGLLAFSTCTFNRSENELQILRLIQEKGYTPLPLDLPKGARRGIGIDEAIRFFPQDGGGEGHFACILRKPGGGDKKRPRPYKHDLSHSAALRRAETLKILAGVTNEVFPPELLAVDKNGCELLPRDYPFSQIPAMRRGVRLTDFSDNRILLHHHFATAADPDLLIAPLALDLGDKRLSAYLAGETFDCEAPDGYKVVTVCGITLGLIKVAGGTAKNHYPKGLRFAQ